VFAALRARSKIICVSMTSNYCILIVGYIFGFYMAWNIGANDVANSMASAVGAKAITIRQAVFIAGILNVLGAIFIGSHVTNTIRKGIVSAEILADPHFVGQFCYLEVPSCFNNPCDCRSYDWFWNNGRWFFSN